MLSKYMEILNILVSFVEVILNTIAIIIVMRAVILGIRNEYKGVGKAKHIICKGISDALNFNLATEVLKIIVGRELKDLVVIGGLLILKAMITGLFMLEIKQDEMRDKLDKRINKEMENSAKKVKSKNKILRRNINIQYA